MDYGEYNHRRLYGRGGLSDQLSSAIASTRGLRGLGVTSDELLRMARSSSLIQPMLVQVDTAAHGDVPSDPAATPVPTGFDCNCAIANLGVDDASAAGLRTLCQTNPSAFAQQLASMNVSGECREWYMEPRNWAIGAGVVAVGALIWWAL